MPTPPACRFYTNKFPEVDDVVMVKVRSIAEMGAYVTLSEYVVTTHCPPTSLPSPLSFFFSKIYTLFAAYTRCSLPLFTAPRVIRRCLGIKAACSSAAI